MAFLATKPGTGHTQHMKALTSMYDTWLLTMICAFSPLELVMLKSPLIRTQQPSLEDTFLAYYTRSGVAAQDALSEVEDAAT